MKKLAMCVVLLVACTQTEGVPGRPMPRTTRVIETPHGAIVQVFERVHSMIHQGTGWVIGEDLVVTDAHVISKAGRNTWIIGGKRATEYYKLGVENRWGDDIVILKVPSLDAPDSWIWDLAPREELAHVWTFRGDYPFDESRTQAGDSGSPVTNGEGQVVANVFGRSCNLCPSDWHDKTIIWDGQKTLVMWLPEDIRETVARIELGTELQGE
jgi:hypothetical protein